MGVAQNYFQKAVRAASIEQCEGTASCISQPGRFKTRRRWHTISDSERDQEKSRLRLGHSAAPKATHATVLGWQRRRGHSPAAGGALIQPRGMEQARQRLCLSQASFTPLPPPLPLTSFHCFSASALASAGRHRARMRTSRMPWT